MSDDIDLDGIERLTDEATEAPFEIDGDDPCGVWGRGGSQFVGDLISSQDARLLVAARNQLPALVAEVRRLREENEFLRADRDHWKANHAEMVKRNDVLRDRPDLPAEKVTPRLAILDELDRLRAKVAAGERLAEAAEPIARQGGVPQDGDLCHVGIMSKEECSACSRRQKLIDAIAAYREGKDGTK